MTRYNDFFDNLKKDCYTVNYGVKEKVEEFYDIFSKQYEMDHSARFADKFFEHFLCKYLPKKENIKSTIQPIFYL